MNVLIYGASNAIAISIARLLHDSGHTAVMADSDKYVRAFFSRYCQKKCLLRDPSKDRAGFSADMAACIEKEAIRLIVPTTDQALLNLVEREGLIPGNVMTTFPLDGLKVKYVLDKANLPELCEKAGVRTPATERVGDGLDLGMADGFQPPFALKRSVGVAGEGFMRVERRELLGPALASVKRMFPESSLLIQEYISGSVHGAGGLFDGEKLTQFYSYRYVRRYPQLSGSPTLCQQQSPDSVRMAFEKVLIALRWKGYCQMDFIVDDKSGEPFLTDINPVHWYTMPYSLSMELNSLAGCFGKESPDTGQSPYTTFSLLRELQRLLSGGRGDEGCSDGNTGYWGYYRHIRRADFYWDPLPVILAPFLKFLRTDASTS